jgi:hypothetical protein
LTGQDEPARWGETVDHVDDDFEDIVVGFDPRFGSSFASARKIDVQASPTWAVDKQGLEVVGGDLPRVWPTGQHEQRPTLTKRLVVDVNPPGSALHGKSVNAP